MRIRRRQFLAATGAALVPAASAVPAPATERRLFDSHFHIIEPRFPLVPNQGYTPPPFPLDTYLRQARPLGIRGGAVVSGSFQGYDQTYLIDALSRLGQGWVGVAQIPPDMPDADIARLGAAGVRALRFNIARGEITDLDSILALARRAHDTAAWHAEFYVYAEQLRPHVDRLAKLPRLSIDHLGMTEAGLPVLLDLASAGAWVKASGFGRVSMNVPDALQRVAARNPGALVFGSDMPSTRAKRAFAPTDIDLIETALGPDLARRVFWDNPVALYRLG